MRKDAPFRRDTTTLEESFENGYQTGVTWNSTWRPGGPYVPNATYSFDAEWKAHCAHKEKCRQYWLKGFDRGIVLRNYRMAEVIE